MPYSYAKFARQIIAVGFIDILGIVQSLIFLPLITKLLGAANYGVWSQLKVTMSLVVPFAFLGLNEALVRFIPGAKRKEDIQEGMWACIWVISCIALVIAAALLLFKNQLSALLNFSPHYVALLAFLVIFETLNSILLVVLRALGEISKYFWIMSSRIGGEAVLVVAAITMGYGLEGAVYAFLAVRVLVCIALFSFLIRRVSIKIPNFSFLKEYLQFGIPTILDNMSYWVVTSIDRYLIGFFLGILFVGYYAPAYALGALLAFFLFPLSTMLSTVLPRFYDQGNIRQVQDYLAHSFKYFLFFVVPSIFGLSLLSKQLLRIFSTKDISDNAYMVIPFIAIAIALYGSAYFFSQSLVLRKKTKIIAVIWMVSAISNVVLNLIFIPKMGIMAAAVITLAAYGLAFGLIWYFAAKEFLFAFDILFTLKIVASSLVMSAAVCVIHPSGILQVVGVVILGAIIYTACMFLFKSIGKKELDFLKNLISST